MPATLLKRDSNVGFFLWDFRNLSEQLFKRKPVVAASVAKTDQKNEKDRYSKIIFVET